MSMRYKGAIISATAPTVTASQASGAWTLQQQYQYISANTWPVFSYPYIEDVFSTYLYTGNGGSSLIINNGIDLSGKGGLIWFKTRSTASGHALFDTARTRAYVLDTSSTSSQSGPISASNDLVSFDSTGFTLGSSFYTNINNPQPLVSWTFRKQPKFFDIVTYTGNGATTRQINHNLGSVPGCIIVKCTNAAEFWAVYHRGTDASAPQDYRLKLNATDARAASSVWKNTAPTATNFTVDQGGEVNASGQTYVAYLFAHNAGGFGASGTDNVISCGSYTGNGSTTGPTVTLGYEPQWLMVKRTDSTSGADWYIFDNMRGMSFSSSNVLRANDSSAESTTAAGAGIIPTATGFQPIATAEGINAASGTYIYIAIRRGPMKTPTTGTSVFSMNTLNGSTLPSWKASFPVDMSFWRSTITTYNWETLDRLRNTRLYTNLTSSEQAITANGKYDYSNGFGANTGVDSQYQAWMFRRAPGFFDVVCYTGNGGGLGTTVPHNLGVKPELIIVKARDTTGNWWVGHKDVFYDGILNLTDAWNTSAYNASVYFSTSTQLSTAFGGNTNGVKFVAYLFASCAGVSKVGAYTGNGSSQTIDCGFTGGARFVMIKRTDSTGDWYVWDTARGMVAGNDSHLSLNSTASEVTTDDSVDTDNSGFIVNQLTATNINVSSATYIYLAIA